MHHCSWDLHAVTFIRRDFLFLFFFFLFFRAGSVVRDTLPAMGSRHMFFNRKHRTCTHTQTQADKHTSRSPSPLAWTGRVSSVLLA
ncbi:hypothetical protein FN846DRAFT_601638 [Sphaerosporella brunnea]|uniref:Uncharacterized protein n=1 Tax=Sphaerosporella brunnea TaxID=1250544 RepID=A0A5J5EBK0_9PEZI|nr:hypothetical protein FN846DRAFT_601638 [Sphaerosporella brunnea]